MSTRNAAGMEFTREGKDMWVRFGKDEEHDILISKMFDGYEVHVHEKVTGAVICGPHTSSSFEVCAMWAKSRARVA